MLKFRASKSLLNVILILSLLIITGWHSALWGAAAEEERVAKLVEGAKKEGRLTWYNQMSLTEAAPMVKKFEEKYPFIKVDIFREGGTQLLTKILTEAMAGRHTIDVVTIAGFHIHALKIKNLLDKYSSPQSLSYPEGARDPEGYATSFRLFPKGIAYNTKIVDPKDIPKRYEDLLSPKWKGKKFAIDNGEEEWFANMLKILGKEKTLALMNNFLSQQPQIRNGNSLRSTLLIAGEYGATLPVNGDRVSAFQAGGAPVEWVGADPVITLRHMAALATKSPHPNAAKLLIDFILSREGQVFIRDVGGVPARLDIEPKDVKLVKGLKLHYSDHSLADNIKETNRLYAEVFKGMKKY